MTLDDLDGMANVQFSQPSITEREVTVTEQSGTAISDYSIKLTFGSGDDVFQNAESDGSDIRFTENQGDSSPYLDHYIREFDSTNETAEIWVKVPSVSASSTASVWMYYDDGQNVKASTTNAFLWFDSVEDGDVAEYSGSGQLNASTGSLGVTPIDGSYWGAVPGDHSNDMWGWKDAYSVDVSSGQGVALDYWYVMAEGNGTMWACMMNNWNESSTSSIEGLWIRFSTNGYWSPVIGQHNNNQLRDINMTWNRDEFMRARFAYFDGTAYWQVTDAADNTETHTENNTTYQTYIGYGGYTFRDQGFDEAWARHYVDPEPDVSVGAV